MLVRAKQELAENMRTDPITGLGNDRLFVEYFAREWKRIVRDRSWISLIKFELDYFEKYKQCYGEIAANNCLQKVARVVKESAQRPADLAIYSQKGQFFLLLPETNTVGAVYIADNLFNKIKDLKILNSQSSVDNHLTISVGITSVKPTQLNTETGSSILIGSLENALKRAIETGRNCRFS